METTLLSDLLKASNGEVRLKALSNKFSSRNKDVESFFNGKAVQSTKLYTSATYLVSEITDTIDVLGYFTLATKILAVKQNGLSKAQERIFGRFGVLDNATQCYEIPAILIAQFGRNFSENSKSISGLELMRIALERTEMAASLTSGKTVFLECEPAKSLVAFYEKCGFKALDNVVFSKTNKKLIQMFRFL